jgi:hypothetical protein
MKSTVSRPLAPAFLLSSLKVVHNGLNGIHLLDYAITILIICPGVPLQREIPTNLKPSLSIGKEEGRFCSGRRKETISRYMET